MGVMCILMSLAFVVWSIYFVHRKRGWMVQFLLALAMLLTGGGFAPPIIGVLAGVAGIRSNTQNGKKHSRLPAGIQKKLSNAWPWIFAVCTFQCSI